MLPAFLIFRNFFPFPYGNIYVAHPQYQADMEHIILGKPNPLFPENVCNSKHEIQFF